MLPYHSLSEKLPTGENTVCFFAREPAGKLVVFVHGFTGKSLETWDRMHELLPLRQESAGWDIVFYGYDSVRVRAMNSANLLRQFIDAFVGGQFQSHRGHGPSGEAPITYNKILIVAHSLGALISRQVVLSAHAMHSRPAWVNSVRLLLFGPAHRGATVAALTKAIADEAGLWGAFTRMAAFYAAPVLKDLEPDSEFVTELVKGSEEARRKFKKPPLIADLVVFGSRDQVVEPLTFCLEEQMFTVDGKGHIDVCKPNAKYMKPLEQVIQLL